MNKNDVLKKSRTKGNDLRESLLGKKVVKGLSNNFFERVLELEIKLKQGFNMDILQELISCYTTAIEYYESINDPRYLHYSQNLNILLSQPEILKQMNLRTREGKKKFKRQQFTQEIKSKFDKVNATEADKQVKTLLSQVSHNEGKANADIMINRNIEGQMSNFQQRKAAKKKKQMLSTSDVTDAIQTMKNKRMNENQNQNKSFDATDQDQLIYKAKDKLIPVSPITKPKNAINLLVNNPELSELQLNEPLDQIDAEFEKEMVSTPNWSTSPLKKKNNVNGKINQNLNDYIKELNSYVYEKMIKVHLKQIESQYNAKIAEKIDITNNYTSQIKEMEYLLNSAQQEEDAEYKNQLKMIITNLVDEEKSELDKVENKYAMIIAEIKKKFNEDSLKNNSGIKLIGEKYMLDISKSLVDLFER